MVSFSVEFLPLMDNDRFFQHYKYGKSARDCEYCHPSLSIVDKYDQYHTYLHPTNAQDQSAFHNTYSGLFVYNKEIADHSDSYVPHAYLILPASYAPPIYSLNISLLNAFFWKQYGRSPFFLWPLPKIPSWALRP